MNIGWWVLIGVVSVVGLGIVYLWLLGKMMSDKPEE